MCAGRRWTSTSDCDAARAAGRHLGDDPTGHSERSDARTCGPLAPRWAERCTGFDRSGFRRSLRVRWAGGCTPYSGGWRWRCSSGACCWSPPARTAGTRRTTPAALHALGASSSATPRLAAALLAKNLTRSSCTTADVGDKAPQSRGARPLRRPAVAISGDGVAEGVGLRRRRPTSELDDLETGPAGGPSTRSAVNAASPTVSAVARSASARSSDSATTRRATRLAQCAKRSCLECQTEGARCGRGTGARRRAIEGGAAPASVKSRATARLLLSMQSSGAGLRRSAAPPRANQQPG